MSATMTRAEALAEAIRQGCSAVDAKAVASTLPDDCSFRTPALSGPAIIANRCRAIAKARADFARALQEKADAFAEVCGGRGEGLAHHNAVYRLNSADDELDDCRARLEDLLKDYGLTS